MGDASDLVGFEGHFDDMINLPELSEKGILVNLQRRYMAEIIYTYTGTILVACNPYKWTGIYEDSYVKQYNEGKFNELPPHIFAIAQAAFYTMKVNNTNQSVIISGESGAGKTESTKLILQFLTAVTSNQAWVEQQIMEANTILESFGNAKTVRNNNSSRFGKFMQVHFNKSRHIMGATIVNYLLEKSRVVYQAKDERNYHCFYQLCFGATAEEKTKYKLKKPEEFHYLNQSGCTEIPSVKDAQGLEALKLAFTVMNMTPEDIDSVFRILAAVLHLGNVKFNAEEGGEKVSVTDMAPVQILGELLEIETDKVKEALINKEVVVRGESTKIPLKFDQANDNRDALSKLLYSRTFDWLVDYINQSIRPKDQSANFIGVLDIFGFELFENNSFEQFCINFANEKLQQFFTNYIFKLEQTEYDKEGINWSQISFTDNAPCIEMIEGKTNGLLTILDEESRFPKATDQTFLAKMEDKYAGKSEFFVKPTKLRDMFGIKHYAGEVLYSITNFLDKNKDEASTLSLRMLETSKVKLVTSLAAMADKEEDAGKDKGKTMKKKATVGGFFKGQLLELVAVLAGTEPQYVRCIKPNPSKSAFKFDEELVIAQLRYSGMLETIRIRKAGYNVRVPFDVFFAKFKCLVPNTAKAGSDVKGAVKQILTDLKIEPSEWQLGKTKVFMRNSVFIPLQDGLDRFVSKMAIRVAKVIKGNYYRRRYQRMQKSSVVVQKNIRMFLCKTKYRRTAKAVVKIQSVVRGWFARDFYRALKEEKRRMEEELRKKREEEERRRREEEEARRSAEAAAAAERERQEKLRQEEEDRKKKQREEEEILKLTLEAQKAKMKMAQGEQLDINSLGDMFSFLDVVDSDIVDKDSLNANLTQVMSNLNSQLDELYETEADDYKKTIKKKTKKTTETAAPASSTTTTSSSAAPDEKVNVGDIYERVQKRSAYRTVRGGPAAMKSNPLMKQMGDEAKKTAEDDHFDDSMEAYGNKFFEEHEKSQGTMGTLRKKKKLSTEEMLQFTKHPIPTSMLKYNDARREKIVQVAIEIFRQVTKILEADSKDASVYPVIQNIVKLGIGVLDLRDEILVQLVRQTGEPTKRPKHWDSICYKSWQLLQICLSSFPPSKGFGRYLKKFLQRSQEVDEVALSRAFVEKNEKKFDDDPEAPKTVGEYIEARKKVVAIAKICEEALHNSVLNGARKFPPSAVEIESTKAGRPIICRFFFLDGVTKAIHIKPSTSAAQALKELAEKIGLPETTGWSIYEVYDNNGKEEEMVVKGGSNIADILARWEIEKRTSSLTETKYQTVKKGAAPVEAVGGGEAKFVVRRRLFRTPQKIPTDPVEYHLIYAQAVHGVLRGDYPINDAAVTRLAALKAQVVWGDYDPKQMARYNEIQQYIPLRYLETKGKDEWIKEIGIIHEKLKGKSELQAKVLYLEAVKQFPMYGAVLYAATFKGFWAYSSHLMIAVHVNGLAWVHPKTKAIMKSYPYSRLQSWELDERTVILNFIADPNQEQEELLHYEFECFQNEELISLLKEYSPSHRTGVTQAEKEAKRIQELDINEEQLGALGAEIEKCREKLIDIKLLRMPGPSTLGGNTGSSMSWSFTTKKKLTLKKEGSGKGTVKKGKEPGETVEVYSIGDWSFSKNRLSFSLMDFDLTTDAELNENALKISGYIASFAGLMPVPPPLEDKTCPLPSAPMVQEVVRLAIESPQLRDELYLQLIKQTTSHPEPDSKTVLRIWKLLAIVTWVVLPSIHVLAYLRAHLRSTAYGSGQGLMRRTNEREFARYCLKAVQRTYTTGPRKQPPAVPEILSVMDIKPIFSRFYFMDAQFRALTFDPAAITSEILEMVKEKVGVKNSTGFSLFESFGSLERAMTGKEKIADTIFKWDKFAKQTNSDKTLKFVFKRRIFMPPLDKFSNDIERDLVMHQAISDVSSDRYPVTEEEASYLSGLRAQIDLGDLSSYSSENVAYSDNVKKYFPKHLVKATAVPLVASHHEKLKGKTADECKKMYMDQICSWEYYGCTIFNVLQSYTSAMPNNLWLCVGNQGVQVLNRRSKTPLLSFPYKSIVNFSPSNKNIMIMTESLTRGTKYVFNTSEASQIAHLIKDYTDTIMASRKKETPGDKGGKTAIHKK